MSVPVSFIGETSVTEFTPGINVYLLADYLFPIDNILTNCSFFEIHFVKTVCNTMLVSNPYAACKVTVHAMGVNLIVHTVSTMSVDFKN